VSGTSPLASVIVVCWNSADVIGRCLRQLLAQDFEDYEIIVVDDGSQDRTVEVAEESLGSGRLTIVRSPLNRGCPHARNLGLKHARGEVIAFIDADGFATPGWLGNIVTEFQADPTVGGVASTVFMESNPLVLNGAGGIVNRQGWAADISMNVPYQRAEPVSEVLYPMGCGMAVRKAAVERVGPFDDHMLNYYDDVDYGIRIWRAGYRVVVADDAWVDHGFGHSGGDSPHKQLLCEQHRMRVVLKHSEKSSLPRWALHEIIATLQSSWPRRELKLKAMRWNLRELTSTLLGRWRLRGAPRPPDRLYDASWGEGFPTGVPKLVRPSPAQATSAIDMSDSDTETQLPYGWFPTERIHGRSYRWAGREAAALIRLERPAKRLRLEYAHVPVDTGGVDLAIRRLGGADPLLAVWTGTLSWQFKARSVENHPIALPAGDYEVVFATRRPWSDPPTESRELGFALASMSFERSFEPVPGDVDMGSPTIDGRLIGGWFGAEALGERIYRWSCGRAALLARLEHPADDAVLTYCLPPGPIGGVRVSVQRLHHDWAIWSTRLPWRDGDWREERLGLSLPAGDYVFCFEADAVWSNPDGADASLSPENRSLGIAVSSIAFGDGEPAGDGSAAR
jgi:GT2 family glycosyltransferase